MIQNERKLIEKIRDTESLLSQSEVLLNESQRLAKMGSWNFDFRTDRLTWSDALYDVFDVDRVTFKETHGSFLSLIDDGDREMAHETSLHSQRTGEPFNIRYRITTPKGEKRIIEEYGFTKTEFQEMTIFDIRPAEDVPRIRALHQDMNHLNKSHFGIHTHKRKSITIN
jgi:PAS domain-containing protein